MDYLLLKDTAAATFLIGGVIMLLLPIAMVVVTQGANLTPDEKTSLTTIRVQVLGIGFLITSIAIKIVF